MTEGAEGAETGPGNRLSAVVLGSLASGQMEFVTNVLAEVGARANQAAFKAERKRTDSPEFLREYMVGLTEGFLSLARVFSTTSDSTVGDFLTGGDENDEARWRLALAFTESSILEAEESARVAPRLVIFQYCISIGVLSFKRSSGVKVVHPGQSALLAGLPYTLASLVAGWWGLPWGPIWTLQTVARNLGGGIDVTDVVAAAHAASS